MSNPRLREKAYAAIVARNEEIKRRSQRGISAELLSKEYGVSAGYVRRVAGAME